MGKRGPKPKNIISIKWSQKFAYAIGLIATDGCLSKDGRHIDFTSKDLELVKIFRNYLGLNNKIRKKARAAGEEKKYFHIQFGDVNFYKFLIEMGLSPAKSKTIGSLKIPDRYFFDFLRGCIDGDGNIRTYKHPESRFPQLRVRIFSASKKFIEWLRREIFYSVSVRGWINVAPRCYCLEYAMKDSINLLNKIYYKDFPRSLSRKFILSKSYLRT
ncbi:MAG: LAGLIDADG family homing endonuclease [bacterium]|nr:LAGLIDADG family homing endonuclease [bacterium]